jgi:hypothetical protein
MVRRFVEHRRGFMIIAGVASYPLVAGNVKPFSHPEVAGGSDDRSRRRQ